MKIYLDVCCLNRPFDDQTQHRIRLESEAVIAILDHCRSKNWQLVGSEVIDFEISQTPDDDRRERVSILVALAQFKVIVDQKIVNRATELQNLGLKPFDALHIACAEKGEVDVLLTTDDELLQKITQKNIIITVRMANPLKWLTEVISE
ncbi:MAG TPA: PIN domain-containing protein [Methanosarcinales archaeon]|nr:PIN domain-containing protein [Methanosarcinales archaeon]